MRILLFGGRGQVGTDLRHVFAGHEVIAPTSDECPIEDRETVAAQFRKGDFDWVINSAAFTKVDDCETQLGRAFAVNAIGARHVASLCGERRVPLVHISTDYVFDGASRSPYVESDTPHPISAYGVSKLAGEFFVRELAPHWIIVRTSAVFGPGHGDSPGVNFVEAVLRRVASDQPLRVVDNQTTSPTFSKDLAGKIVELMDAGARGIFHVTNRGQCSFFELACKITELVGAGKEVTPISSSELNRGARRPAYSVLANTRLQELDVPLMRPWEEALEEYLQKHHGKKHG